MPAVAEVLPLALGIAASPFPVVPAILLLFTARPGATAGSFLGGWVVGVGGATGLFVVLASVVEAAEETPTWASWARLVLGALLVVVGVRQWLRRDAEKEAPAWMRSLESAGPSSAFRLGVLLSAANPKILLLAAAGGLAIGSDDAGTSARLTAVLAFTAIASVTVAAPLVLHGLLGERVTGPLARAKDWLAEHNAAVMAVVIVVLGGLLVVKGAGGL